MKSTGDQILQELNRHYGERNYRAIISKAEELAQKEYSEEVLRFIGLAYDQQALLESDLSERRSLQDKASEYALLMGRLYPASGKSYRLLGLIRQHQGNDKEALALYQKAYDLNPDDATIFLSLGNGYRANGEKAQAIQWYERAAAEPGLELPSFINLVALFEEMGDEKKAKLYAEKSLVLLEKQGMESYQYQKERLLKIAKAEI